jgi:hypothetical protein
LYTLYRLDPPQVAILYIFKTMPMAWYTCPRIRVIFQQINLFVWSDHRSHFQTSIWMLSGISVNEAATNPHCHLTQAVAVLFDMYSWMCLASSNAPKPPPTANNVHCILKQMWNGALCLLKCICDKPQSSQVFQLWTYLARICTPGWKKCWIVFFFFAIAAA